MNVLLPRAAVAQTIREYLEWADSEGQLPMFRGVISRRAICRKFHIPSSWTQSGPLKSVFTEYDEILRARGYSRSKFDGILDDVRQFLEDGLANGSVPVSRTLISRTAIQEKFGVPCHAIRRHSELKQLLLEFDQRVADGHLQASRYQSYAQSLNELLNDCIEGRRPVPTYRGRLNRSTIARELHCSERLLRTVPILRQAVDSADSRLAAATQAIREEHSHKGVRLVRQHLVIYIPRHKRSWDFNLISEQFSEMFAVSVARAFSKCCSGDTCTTARNKYEAIFSVFTWLDNNAESHRGVVDCLRRAECPRVDEFEWACAGWRSEQIRRCGEVSETTVSRRISNVTVAMRHLASAGVLPRIRDLPPLRGARSRTKPRASVAEITRISQVACDALRTVGHANGIDIEAADEAAFIRVLEEEAQVRTDLPDDTVSAIRIILSDRLTALRTCAVKDFDRWSQHFDRGQEILADVDMRARSVEDLVYSNAASSFLRLQDVRSAFPSSRPDLALSRFLALIEHRWAGCPPRGNTPGTWEDRGQFYRSFYSKHGGFEQINAFMNAHDDAVIATVIMYLVDSGANLSTARTLWRDCLEQSELPGHRRISGYKARVSGKVIFSDLPVKAPGSGVTTIQAVEKLAVMTAHYRCQADEEDALNLFLVRPQSKVKALSEHRLLSLFKAFCNRHPELKGLKLLPSMIRPSVLLDLALSKDGNIISAQYHVQHADQATTDGYTRKWPVRLLYEEKIKFFMRQWQAIAIAPVAGAAERLGITVAELEELLSHAERNGLGSLCLKPMAGIQPGTKQGETCHLIERCIGCCAQIVVPEPEVIADMIIFNEELWKDQERFEAEQEDRWEELWLHWLAFTEVAIEAMSKGPQAAVLSQARQLASARRAEASYVPLRPW
jgi:hypothetical protein